MKKPLVIALVVAALAAVAAAPAAANHRWGNYHWARPAGTFTLALGNNLSGSWPAHLGAVSSDWSRVEADATWTDATPPPANETRVANPLRTQVVTGGTTGRKCRPSPSRVEVCNAAYGNNGWLGLASIWASGDHISQATVKVNDSYMASGTYGTPTWRQSVLCQEVGHTFGLDHQDESGADLDTCMDYSRSPNLHPDQHDFNLLGVIYGHGDRSSGGSVVSSGGSGRGLRRVREGLYVEDLGDGGRRWVWVLWAGKGQHPGPPDEAPA